MARKPHPPPAQSTHSTSTNNNNHSSKNDDPTSVQTLQETPFFKELASTNDTVRARAFTSLRSYLTQRAPSLTTSHSHSHNNGSSSTQETTSPPKPPLELQKLHRALISLMWLTPHMGPQQELALGIAALGRECFLVPAGAGSEGVRGFFDFVAAFWMVLCREWINIDSLRLDKYLWLARFVVREGLVVCAERAGGTGPDTDADTREENKDSILALHNSTLTSTVLHPTDQRIPNGLRYHVLDVYVDELSRARETRMARNSTGDGGGGTKEKNEGGTPQIDTDEETRTFLQTLLLPISQLTAASPTKTVRNRAKECLSDERLWEWGVSASVGIGDRLDSREEVVGEKRKREREDEGEEEYKEDGDADDFTGFD